MQLNLSAACLLTLALAVPATAAPARPADPAEQQRVALALVRETQALLDRTRTEGALESGPQRSARRSLALARQLLAMGNARVAESMALQARRALTPSAQVQR